MVRCLTRRWAKGPASSNQGLICCFSNRGDKVSMCHFKEIEIGCINDKMSIKGTEPPVPFRASLLFGYAQSGYERTSFSGSTVNSAAFPVIRRPIGAGRVEPSPLFKLSLIPSFLPSFLFVFPFYLSSFLPIPQGRSLPPP